MPDSNAKDLAGDVPKQMDYDAKGADGSKEEDHREGHQGSGYNAATGLVPGQENDDIEPEAVKEWHKFWSKQPVCPPHLLESLKDADAGTILHQTVDDIQKEPFPLPAGFVWDDLDLNDDEHMESLYCLLRDNYVEDSDGEYRFLYSKNFLKWALCVPGMKRSWHVVVRWENTGALMGFISAVPIKMKLHFKEVPCVEINLLCVSKRLRGKRLAPVLIAEATRRVRVLGIYHAVYTAGIELPGAYTTCQYYHRILKTRKALDIEFTRLKGMSYARFEKKHRPPRTIAEGTWRKPTTDDAEVILELIERFFERKNCGASRKGISYDSEGDLIGKKSANGKEILGPMRYRPILTIDEIKHYLINASEDVVFCRVRELDDKIEDFVSFYCLPSQVLKKHKGHELLDAAFLYYNAGSLSCEERISALIYLANQEGKDVVNGLVMNNQTEELLEELEFGQGDGFLRHYAFNWRGSGMSEGDIGLILV